MSKPLENFEEQSESFDRIALDLQILREESGHVSYAELVRRITRIRLARGVPAVAAVPARSTVYSAFRTGRARMDIELLRDIVVALSAGREDADRWIERCRMARTAHERVVKKNRQDAIEQLPPPTPLASVRIPERLSRGYVLLVLFACVAVNLIGLSTTHVFKLSVYLDMVGTGIASVILGPWHGVAVAIASSGLGVTTGDPATVYFTPVNVAGALIWGYGIKKFRMGSGLLHYVSLNVCVALGCTLVATPIVVHVFSGYGGHASVQATSALEAIGLPLMVAVFSANIVTSVIDKLLTGIIVITIFSLLLHYGRKIPADHMPLMDNFRAKSVDINIGRVRFIADGY